MTGSFALKIRMNNEILNEKIESFISDGPTNGSYFFIFDGNSYK